MVVLNNREKDDKNLSKQSDYDNKIYKYTNVKYYVHTHCIYTHAPIIHTTLHNNNNNNNNNNAICQISTHTFNI